MPPSASTLERLVRHDRAVVGTAVALLALLAWAYVIRLAAHMTGDAAGSEMATPAMMGPELKEWSAADGAFMFIMWAVMMTAMMTPSVGPMVLIHARVARRALAGGKAFAATGWFCSGLPSRLDGVRGRRHSGAMAPRARRPAYARDAP